MNYFSRSLYPKVIALAFILMTVWWFSIFDRGLVDTVENYLYGVALGCLPLLGAFFGFLNAKNWGGWSSSMGRALILLSAGAVTWGTGTLTFAYYNLSMNVAVPYPSVADLFYILSWPLWISGMIQLSKATGAKYQLKSLGGKLAIFLVPASITALSYYLLISVARDGSLSDFTNPVKAFFDLAYPVGDILILTTSALVFGLSFRYLGGIFKWPIIVLLSAFVFNYFSDFSFSYFTTIEQYFVANWVDLLFSTTFFLLSLGVSLLTPPKKESATQIEI